MSSNVGSNSKVRAILWHQGEIETSSLNSNYIREINTLFTNMRNDIRTLFPTSSNVPVLIGGLSLESHRNRITGVFSNSPSKRFNDFLQSNVVPTIPNCRFVPSGPMPGFNRYLEGDSEMDANGQITKINRTNGHFSATSQREFGKRYFNVFNSMV